MSLDPKKEDNEVLSLLRQLTVDVGEIKGRQSEFESRLKAVEKPAGPAIAGGHRAVGGRTDYEDGGRGAEGNANGGARPKQNKSGRFNARSPPTVDEIGEDDETEFAEYASVKDLVKKVKLPPKLLLGDTSFYVVPDSKKTLNLVRRAGGFVQTSLRVLRDIDDRGAAHCDDIENLFVCLESVMKLLQNEAGQLMFEGAGMHRDHVKLVRSLAKSDFFTDQDIRAVEFATVIKRAALVSNEIKAAEDAKNRRARSSNSNYRGNNNNFSYTNKGFGPSNYRERDQRSGGYNNQQRQPKDNFDSVVTQSTKL